MVASAGAWRSNCSNGRKPTERVGDLERLEPGCLGDHASGAVAGHDSFGPDCERFAVRCRNRPYLHIRPVLHYIDDLCPEADLTTFRDERVSPITDKLLLRVDVVPLTIIAGSSVIADDNFAIDTEFADSIAASALGDGIGKTEGSECGDCALLNKSGLRPTAQLARLLTFQDHERDVRLVKDMGEYQPSGTSANDAYQRVVFIHVSSPWAGPALNRRDIGRLYQKYRSLMSASGTRDVRYPVANRARPDMARTAEIGRV